MPLKEHQGQYKRYHIIFKNWMNDSNNSERGKSTALIHGVDELKVEIDLAKHANITIITFT